MLCCFLSFFNYNGFLAPGDILVTTDLFLHGSFFILHISPIADGQAGDLRIPFLKPVVD